ncbi:hypothetical protein [Alicyclobacillus tolerans]|uniref:hypothetical protein n=1 Tax=Alicyclobacillus tolerans TaxID=90970 RepID=UPI003B987486
MKEIEENIDNLTHDQVLKLIRAVKFSRDNFYRIEEQAYYDNYEDFYEVHADAFYALKSLEKEGF